MKSLFVLVHGLDAADVCLHSDFLPKVFDDPGTVVFLFLTPYWVSAEEVGQVIVLTRYTFYSKIISVCRYDDIGDFI